MAVIGDLGESDESVSMSERGEAEGPLAAERENSGRQTSRFATWATWMAACPPCMGRGASTASRPRWSRPLAA